VTIPIPRDNNTIIQTYNLTKVFGEGDSRVVAYEDINIEIKRGEFVCLLGPSGCGKTTLLRGIVGTEPATSGKLDIHYRRDSEGADVAMVFQQHGLFPWMTLEKNLRFVLRSSPIARDLEETIVDRFVEKVGLSRFRKFYPYQMSGGMCQRVNLIRAFAIYPQVLLMDEPFVFLDYQNRYLLMDLLLDLWAEQQQTILFVTHNINEAVILGDRVLVMTSSPGRIKASFDIPFERPRNVFNVRKDPVFGKLSSDISDVVRDEVERASRLEEEECLLGNVKKVR